MPPKDAPVIDPNRIVNVPEGPKPIDPFAHFPMAPELPNDDPFPNIPDLPNDDILSNLDPKHEIKSDFGDPLQLKDKKSSLVMK